MLIIEGMRVGVTMTFNHVTKPEFIAEAVQRVEAAGFNSVWLPEHVVFFPEYQSRYPYSGAPEVVTVEWQLGHHFLRHTIYHLMQIAGKRYRPVAEFPQLPVPEEAKRTTDG